MPRGLTLDYNYFPNTIVNPWFPTLPLPAVDSSASGEALPFADDTKAAATCCCFAGMPWVCPEHCQMEEIFNLCFTDLQSTGALLYFDTCSQLQSCLAARGQMPPGTVGVFFSRDGRECKNVQSKKRWKYPRLFWQNSSCSCHHFCWRGQTVRAHAPGQYSPTGPTSIWSVFVHV